MSDYYHNIEDELSMGMVRSDRVLKHVQHQRSRIEELEAENHLLKSSGIIEVAVRNPNVMEYMRHWEGRAEAAEANMAKQEALMAAGFAEYERRLAKAVEALQKLDVGEGWAAQIARTTLAELTGGKDGNE